MAKSNLFPKMSYEEKVNFFLACQELLIKYHKDSHFMFREDNLESRKEFAMGFINAYKGYAYQDENVCVLFNYIKLDDAGNPNKAITSNMYKEPAPDYNAVSIDFVVFRDMSDCRAFIGTYYSPQIKHVMFVRNNEVKIYETSKLLDGLRVTR